MFGHDTAEVDPRFDKCYFAGVMRFERELIRLDDGTVLEYHPWEVAVDISDMPYEKRQAHA